MNYVIEYIGGDGVRHTELTHPAQGSRWARPEPGDVVDFSAMNGVYPFTKTFGTIERIGDCVYCDEDEAHLCCEPGSIFWGWISDDHDGRPYVSISGGPFATVKLSRLEPTYSMRLQLFWNWGRNGAGAGHGVHYHVMRPVFKLLPS